MVRQKLSLQTVPKGQIVVGMQELLPEAMMGIFSQMVFYWSRRPGPTSSRQGPDIHYSSYGSAGRVLHRTCSNLEPWTVWRQRIAKSVRVIICFINIINVGKWGGDLRWIIRS